MTYVDALREGNRFAQKREFARGAYAEWQRFIGLMGGKLDALVERYRLNTTDWLPLAPLRFVRDRLAGVLDWALYRPLDKSERVVVRVEESAPITEEREWALATGAIHAAAELAQSAAALQRSAALQIDAAIYALDDLMAELRSVMDVGSRKGNVFAHQADCEYEPAPSLFAVAVTAAVRDVEQSREKIQNAA